MSVVLALAGVALAGPPDYEFQTIDHPAAGPLGTSICAINNPGRMVGNYENLDGLILGFLLRDGQFTDAAVPGAFYHALTGIDNHDTAIGIAVSFEDDQVLFRRVYGDSRGDHRPAAGLRYWGRHVYKLDQRSGHDGGVRPELLRRRVHRQGFVLEDGEFMPINVPGATLTFPDEITNSGTIGGSCRC